MYDNDIREMDGIVVVVGEDSVGEPVDAPRRATTDDVVPARTCWSAALVREICDAAASSSYMGVVTS